MILGGEGKSPEYVWTVEEGFAAAANRFIQLFNEFVPSALPAAEPANVRTYFRASTKTSLWGRCIRIGTDLRRHYHWVTKSEATEQKVEDFWSDEIWTTKKYRDEQRRRAQEVERSRWLERLS